MWFGSCFWVYCYFSQAAVASNRKRNAMGGFQSLYVLPFNDAIDGAVLKPIAKGYKAGKRLIPCKKGGFKKKGKIFFFL